MFVKRDMASLIKDGAKQVPVVAIIGPRQSGKSTLAKKLFPDHTYLDMQDSDILEFANSDPKAFLNTYKNEHGLIIDEAQYAPKLFSQIKVESDKNPQLGYYVLPGSQNFLLHEKISESLAGRVYFYNLLPFSIQELKSSNLLLDNSAHQMFKGFYPRVYQPNVNYENYYQNYVSTYVERDIRSIKNIENIMTFQKFLKICALRVGQPLNYSELALACGISMPTVKSWLSILQASFIIFFLEPYFSNLGKRVLKSPRLFFYDTGLLLSLMELDIDTLVKKREIYGFVFENMVIADLIKDFNTLNKRYTFTFFRDTNQKEVDLVIECAGKTIPVEIKSSLTLQQKFFKNINWFKQELDLDTRPVLVYSGDENQKRSLVDVISWKNLDKIIL